MCLRDSRTKQATDYNIIPTKKMCYASWITEETDTHSNYIILIDFRRQQWISESVSLIPYNAFPLFYSNMLI